MIPTKPVLKITLECVICHQCWIATDRQIEDAREAECFMCSQCFGPAIVKKAELS